MGRGKVHPSPSPAAAAAGGGGDGGGWETAEAVLMRVLPVAVLAMAAPLGPEGKEVLAYLVLASLRSTSPARVGEGEEEEGKCKGGSGRVVVAGAAHPPELGCGCFGCYTAYWSRWDGSPERDRDAIHRAIEAFEEHLARKEEEEDGGGGKASARRRKKRGKEKKGKAKVASSSAAQPPPPPLPSSVPEKVETSSSSSSAAAAAVPVAGEWEEAAEEMKAAAGDGVVEEERRRRGWGGVAGVFSWRGWSLWGSH
ncbi:uncharacterized protein LOC102717196 [Oryza brachyantha]|uniref:Uncharacterized protein n=1 Tax=Oryza brachyantha TaxID=4533 RepID=J3N8H0_ORYBR|nr:uncharacterized protein LOC102717196 [Oryza brachyantha]